MRQPLLSSLTVAFGEEGFSYVEKLTNPLMNQPDVFSIIERNSLVRLAELYGKMTISDVVIFNEWIDKNYPKIEGVKIGSITRQTLQDHEKRINEFFNSKLSIITENNWLEGFTSIEAGKASRIAKLEYLKGRLNGIPKELLDELLGETGAKIGETAWGLLKGSVLNPDNPVLGSFQEVAQDKFEKLKKVDTKFNQIGFEISEIFEFIELFKEIAIGEAFVMLSTSKKILLEEQIRYSQQEGVNKLYQFITKNYKPDFWKANLLRAEAAIRLIRNVNRSNFFANQLTPLALQIQNNLDNPKMVAGIISVVQPKELIISLALLLKLKELWEKPVADHIADAVDPKLILMGDFEKDKYERQVYNSHPNFRTADEMDAKTISSIHKEGAESFPILSDISFDFRRLFVYGKKNFGIHLRKELKQKIENNQTVTNELRQNPSTIWKLELLLDKVCNDYGISLDSPAGSVIADYQKDKADEEFWESIGMTALGIGLGIAGFFTAGATWVGLGLMVAGIAVSSYDIYQAIDEYQFRDAAKDTSLDDLLELSKQEPSIFAVILSVIGLAIDGAALLKALRVFKSVPNNVPASQMIEGFDIKALRKLNHALNELSKKSASSEQVRLATKKIYETIGKGRLKGNPDFETFFRNVEEVLQKNKVYSSYDTELMVIFKHAKIDDVLAKNLLEGLPGLGLKQIYELDPIAAKRIIEAFAKNPKALYQFTVEAALDKSFTSSLIQLSSKIRSQVLFEKTLSYLSNNRRTGLPSLAETLRHLDLGNVVDEKLITEVITNPKLRVTLRNMDDPKELNALWKQFSDKKTQSTFSEFAQSKVQFRQNQLISSRYANFTELSIRQKNLTLIGDTEPHLAELLKNGKLLPDNPQLKEALEALLEKELIGNTTALGPARGKVIAELNKVIGSQIRNVDEFKEVMKLIEQPASRGSIGEYYVLTKNYFQSGGSQIIKPRIIVEGFEGFDIRKFIEPDQIRLNPNRTLDVKVGYRETDIDAEQLDLYYKLVSQSATDEAIQTTLKQIGVPNGKLTGHDYLFLPGADGDALSAAKRAYEIILFNRS